MCSWDDVICLAYALDMDLEIVCLRDGKLKITVSQCVEREKISPFRYVYCVLVAAVTETNQVYEKISELVSLTEIEGTYLCVKP